MSHIADNIPPDNMRALPLDTDMDRMEEDIQNMVDLLDKAIASMQLYVERVKRAAAFLDGMRTAGYDYTENAMKLKLEEMALEVAHAVISAEKVMLYRLMDRAFVSADTGEYIEIVLNEEERKENQPQR